MIDGGMMEILNELQEWYKSHCDGDWEHIFGISIGTLDDPGWIVKISLTDTLLEDEIFETIKMEAPVDSPQHWLHCYKETSTSDVDESKFIGMGGPDMLEEILKIFLDWAKAHTDTTLWDDALLEIESKCQLYANEDNPIEYLRKLFNELDFIPTEHPRKKKVLELFYKCWNDAVAKYIDLGQN